MFVAKLANQFFFFLAQNISKQIILAIVTNSNVQNLSEKGGTIYKEEIFFPSDCS